MDSPIKAVQDVSDPDFVWEDYLEETQAKAAPPTAFTHVEESLVSTLKIGMKLEVANPEEENCYWVASVVMICGPLLSLRYLGYGEDRSADFWFDLVSGEFHPVGWCTKNCHKLYPPKGVRERHEDFMSLIVPELEADTIPLSLLESPESGITPIDQIKMEMLVEISEESNYGRVWPAKVVQNVGGRILLRYLNSPESGECDFWLFYLSERLHPIGWGKDNGAFYIPPSEKQINLSESEQNEILSAAFTEAEEFPFPVHILEPQKTAKDHGFKENMKLEVLDPRTRLHIRAATVTKVISSKYFIVEVDNLQTAEGKLAYPPVCCSSHSLNIFPCKWAKENGLDVLPPDGYMEYDEKSLDWDKYLLFSKSVPAPRNLFCQVSSPVKFEVRMKLETVLPAVPDQIHAATVSCVKSPLLWIQLDSAAAATPNHVVPYNSFEIFPVGWCASNAYPLHTPVFQKKSASVPTSAEHSQSSQKMKEPEANGHKGGKSWCPKIYFNHCCFTGPYLSKSRLAELPQAIGPGPLHLVMKDVLTRLINIAYKSSRVLKELQICGKPNPNMLQQTIKAKYKGKSYRATVEFIRNSEQIEEFCHSICRKLDCCPHLFGPNHVGQDCPENCYNLTKTKFSNGFMKKQKKTNGTTSATDDGTEVKRGPGRRKKRKHWRLLHAANKLNQQNGEKKSQDTVSEEKEEPHSPKETTPKTSDSDDETPAKRKLLENNHSDSKIVTRGAKLPNFALDKPWKQTSVKSSSGGNNMTTGTPMVRKVGRPLGSTKKAIAAALTSRRIAERQAREDGYMNIRSRALHDTARIGIPSNPLEWSVNDVVKYIRSTPCAPVAPLLRDQEIDGQALLMLTLYSVQEFLHLKQEPAKVFCSLIEKLKYEFFMHYAK